MRAAVKVVAVVPTILLTCWAGACWAQEPAAPPSAAEKELARSIVHDTAVGYLPTDVRSHLGRAMVLARLALRIDPGCASALRVLAEAAESLGKTSEAAAAEGAYVRAVRGGDYAAAVNQLRCEMAALSTAEQREQMLQAVAADTSNTKPVQAKAQAELAAIKEGRGDMAAAIESYRASLEIDVNQREALAGLLRLVRPIGPAEQTDNALAMLRGNPLAINVAWELGQLCRRQGLYDKALTLYEYAWAVAEVTGQARSEAFRRDFLDALLDGGLDERAVAEFAEVVAGDPVDLGAASLLVEAYRRLGKARQADELVLRMHQVYRPREALGITDGALGAELAWFNLVFRGRKQTAMDWAQKGLNMSADDPFVQRVWGVAFLRVRRSEEARLLLERLAGTDIYAAAELAAHAFAEAKADRAAEILAKTAGLSRSGPAWRRLKAVAAEHAAELPPPTEEAVTIGRMIAVFVEQGHLQLGRNPERFLAVTLVPVAAAPYPGEPLAVRATLTNIGRARVPLGEWGLMSPKMMLNVELLADGGRLRIAQRTPVVWPAPRYIMPGQSLQQVVRVDGGRIGTALASRPLVDVEVNVIGILDPVERRGEFVSGLKKVAVDPARILRRALVAAQTPADYDAALKQLVNRLGGADEIQAMHAAEATVSLVLLAEKVKAGRPSLGGKLAPSLREPELLAMLRHCLLETPVTVRCRTLGAMGRLKLTELMLRMIAPCTGHDSPWVRTRAVELLGTTGEGRFREILESFAGGDPDELVREMARRVMPPP